MIVTPRTKEQSLDLQVDALRKAGCEKVYREVVSGAKAERPVLDALLRELRAGDVLVIWKLDRLGRSLRHLVELAGTLLAKRIGLKRLNDPIDMSLSNTYKGKSLTLKDTEDSRSLLGLSDSIRWPNGVGLRVFQPERPCSLGLKQAPLSESFGKAPRWYGLRFPLMR